MNRGEAVACLRQILVEAKIAPDIFSIIEPENDGFADGYKIKISISMDTNSKQKIVEISQNYGLAVIEENKQIIIYKPNHLKQATI